MRIAIGKRGIKQSLDPTCGEEPAVGGADEPIRRLHPAIGRENPEGRNQGADGDEACGHEVQLGPHALQPKQHDAQKARFEEEGGEHFVAEERPDHRPNLVREHRPVSAKLIGHDQPGDDAHGEDDGEDAEPILEGVEEQGLLGREPASLQHRQKAGQPDGEGRIEEVPDYDEGELGASQIKRARQMQTGHQASDLISIWSSWDPQLIEDRAQYER
jgi:hypothetical protein